MHAASGTSPTGDVILNDLFATENEITIPWERDVTIILDNWRMLHARPALSASDDSRVLERVMVA